MLKKILETSRGTKKARKTKEKVDRRHRGVWKKKKEEIERNESNGEMQRIMKEKDGRIY